MCIYNVHICKHTWRRPTWREGVTFAWLIRVKLISRGSSLCMYTYMYIVYTHMYCVHVWFTYTHMKDRPSRGSSLCMYTYMYIVYKHICKHTCVIYTHIWRISHHVGRRHVCIHICILYIHIYILGTCVIYILIYEG